MSNIKISLENACSFAKKMATSSQGKPHLNQTMLKLCFVGIIVTYGDKFLSTDASQSFVIVVGLRLTWFGSP